MIVPKVDDNGNISGTYFMYNTMGYETKPIKLKSGKEYKKSFVKFKDDEKMRFSRMYQEIEGQWVQPITQYAGDRLNIKTMEGENYIDLGFDSIETFDRKKNPEIKNYRGIKQYL